MEISEPSISIFYLSKLFAFAPYSCRTNSKGSFDIKRSLFFTVYSVAIITALIVLTYRGLLFDANSKFPVRASFRMKSATSKVVTGLDVSVVVFPCVAGALCALFGLKSTRELNIRLKRIDDSLHSYSYFKRDRIRAYCLLCIPLITITSLLGLDISTWYRFAVSVIKQQEATEDNVTWYFPFYGLYFILTGLHVAFANTTFGIGRRYSRLNKTLRNAFLMAEKKKDVISKQKVTTVKTLMQNSVNTSFTRLNTESSSNAQSDNASKNKVTLIKVLAENHESLGKCMTNISSSFGIVVLFILVSCLLHLVITAYFLILGIFNKKEGSYIWLQILWILFHICRLLMVVEPCHLATTECKKTIQIVCEIERKVYDPIIAEEIRKFWQQLLVADPGFSACGLCRVNRKILTAIKKFWQQLLVTDPGFSACGLCRVNRTILTAFSSAIATYLVILIQFQ